LMGTALGLLTLPFRAAWSLVKLLALPVLIVAVAALVLDTGSAWFGGVLAVCGLWALALVRLWRLRLRGELRSLARGTVHVDGRGGRERGRRRRGVS
jgi:hypothetical protein